MKKILILLIVLLAALAAYWFFGKGNNGINLSSGDDMPRPSQVEPTSSRDTDKFSGTLEEVNTGCFADAECYVVVGGKHVTVLKGRTINPVIYGTIMGVPTIDALEPKIGSEVEVYAAKLQDGTYTLEGNQEYYIRLK